MIVSISGMDNSGKTTQINNLQNKYPDLFIKKLHIKDMPSYDKKKYVFDWWFDKNNAEEFTYAIYKCLYERMLLAKSIDENGKIVILEKGFEFYECRIAATLMSKGYSLEEAINIKNRIKLLFDFEDIEEIKIFLNFGNYPKKEMFTPSEEMIYEKYLNINKLLLLLSKIDYKYIEPGEVDEVSKKIINEIKESKKINAKKRIIKKTT